MLKKQILYEFLEILLALIDKRIIKVDAKLKSVAYIVNENCRSGEDALDKLTRLKELCGR